MIFLFLLSSGVSAYFVAIQSQTDMLETQEVYMGLQTKKMHENFDISIAADSDNNNRLSILTKNQGSSPVEITDFWIINKTDTVNGYPAKRYIVNYADRFIPPGYGTNILENYPLYMNPDTYDVKVISTIGTIHKQELTVGGNNNLRAALFTIPPDVRIGENVTIALHVTNIGNVKILNVTAGTPMITPSNSVVLPLPSNHLPVHLKPSESVFFNWEYTVSGSVGNKVTFQNNATGIDEATGFSYASNNALEKITLREDEGGQGEEIIIKDELFGKPEIFMIFPNILGDDPNDRALWGVNVANPTDQPIYVNKVVLVAISPRATSSDKIFEGNCEDKNSPEDPQTISPTTDKWSCPESNQLMWKDLDNPQVIQPRSVFPFLVKIGSGNMGSSLPDAINVVIQASVFSTLGQFGKAGYISAMHSSDVALPNVYLATTLQSTSNSDILGEIRGITSGSTVTFNATLADMDDNTTYGIKSGTKLIINLPKEWTFNNLISHTGFNVPVVQTFPDNSTQISGELSAFLNGATGGRTIQFSATAPSVTAAKMYVMHILADGKATGDSSQGDDFTAGPIAETVLQVCPTSGCP